MATVTVERSQPAVNPIKSVTLVLDYEEAHLVRDLLGACPDGLGVNSHDAFFQLCGAAPELEEPKKGRRISTIKYTTEVSHG